MDYLGEIFALGAASCWAFGTILFGIASNRVGSFSVNSIRIPMTATILIAAVLISRGRLIPADATVEQLLLLALSGFLGLVIGDSFYFRCLVLIGPRLASLLAASSPVVAAAISWVFLGEQLGIVALIGMTTTLTGIVWVSRERHQEGQAKTDGSRLRGVVYGFIGGAGQAAGLVVAKIAMADSYDPLSASLVRMVAAALIIWFIVIISGKTRSSLAAIRDKRSLAAMSGAALIGPFLGIWLSLLAIRNTEVGIASTLMSLTPVIIIPLVIVVHKQKPSPRAILGTFVAIAGVALIFLR